MYSLVQALTLTVWLYFLIQYSNNRFFNLYCKDTQKFRTDHSEFQGQNFKVGGTLGAELGSLFLHTGSA